MVELAHAKSVAGSGQAGPIVIEAISALSSEQYFEAALTGSGVAMWDWDIASDAVSLSTQWQVMLGAAGEPTLTTFRETRINSVIVERDSAARMFSHPRPIA